MTKHLLLASLVGIALTFGNCASDTVEPAVALPSGLSYSPSSLTLSQGSAGTSATPTISGAAPITFSLANSPSAAITIDATTGVISVASSIAAGSYGVSVSASNAGGSVTFEDAYTIQVNASNTAPSTLTFSSSNITIRKHETKSISATTNGSPPLTFSLTNAASLPTGISINQNTGQITLAKNIEHGSYTLSVEVSNDIGSQTFTDIVSVNSEAVVFTGSIGVQVLMQNKCAPCHVSGGSNTDYTRYNNASSSANSIFSRVNSGNMPQGGPKLPQIEIDLIQQWINDGKLEN